MSVKGRNAPTKRHPQQKIVQPKRRDTLCARSPQFAGPFSGGHSGSRLPRYRSAPATDSYRSRVHLLPLKAKCQAPLGQAACAKSTKGQLESLLQLYLAKRAGGAAAAGQWRHWPACFSQVESTSYLTTLSSDSSVMATVRNRAKHV